MSAPSNALWHEAPPPASPAPTLVAPVWHRQPVPALTAAAVRDALVLRLFSDAGLSCSAIATLRWEMVFEGSQVRNRVRCVSPASGHAAREIPVSFRHALAELNRSERQLGFGGPRDFVVRFRGGSADLVTRANSVRRVLSRGTSAGAALHSRAV